ncbi:YeaH/YhbH family protein [Methylosinus sp. Sm6]|uniref:YeaH/YhbH family protein n=1 Tax=Methylosinus sp. Sm6 TaxID=2866948 RepID=UPI001C992F41|nr:YeaH/YhbH family protein [Methylosinus sp. Sm6]MBY6241887.1 YeaH/YhbH family protein [Methylosinus sp. Sm6]
MHIVDRRLNPGSKSFANRQRFLRRAKDMVEKAVREASKDRAIGDLESPGEISIPSEGTREPTFRHTQGSRRDLVLPGNKEYVEGDLIERPQGEGEGEGAGGQVGRGDGQEDAFRFILTRDEFLSIFLDDLELPDLAKRRVAQTEKEGLRRAGYTTSGTPANLALHRTLQTSLSRRIALKRPKQQTIDELAQRIEAAALRDSAEAERLRAELKALQQKRARISYLDPIDLRYRRFERFPKPVTQAVMFCLMDVSGSMTEHMKDLAKRFFMLLHVFLTRRYKRVEIVFIRHTDRAGEVDEETFFRSAETGGTMVSSALQEMARVIRERYDPGVWNIYAAQASDGDNLSSDNPLTRELLQNHILPLCQYFAYVEVSGPNAETHGYVPHHGQSSLWITYATLQKENDKFQMRRVSRREHIYSVFRQLFQRRAAKTAEAN